MNYIKVNKRHLETLCRKIFARPSASAHKQVNLEVAQVGAQSATSFPLSILRKTPYADFLFISRPTRASEGEMGAGQSSEDVANNALDESFLGEGDEDVSERCFIVLISSEYN